MMMSCFAAMTTAALTNTFNVFLSSDVYSDPFRSRQAERARCKWYNPEIARLPVFRDAALVYHSERQAPDAKGLVSTWRTVKDNFVPGRPVWDSVLANEKPDKPVVLVFTSKRNVLAMAGDIDLDLGDWEGFKKAMPNLIGTRTMCEWGNDLLLNKSRTGRILNENRRASLEAVWSRYSMTNRYDRLAMCEWYKNRKLDIHYGDLGTFMAFRASYYLDHVAAAWGAKTLTAETTNTTTDDSEYRWDISCCFVRGAARQFGLPWSWYVAVFFNGLRADGTWQYNSWPGYIGPKADPRGGVSASAQRRVFYYAYLNGANAVQQEDWLPAFLTTNTPDGRMVLTRRGRDFSDFYEFTRAHPERGSTYAPVAILTPFAQGYTAYGGNAWCSCPYTPGDYALDAVFFTISPGWERLKGLKLGLGEHNLCNSEFALMYDVLVPDTPQSQAEFAKVLARYPVVILAGDYPNPSQFAKTLADYERAGGRILRITPDMLPPFRSDAVPDIKRGRLVFPKVAEMLRGLQAELFPFQVSGDCRVGANRTANGWWLWVFNNKGVIKFTDTFERIDQTKRTDIVVRSKTVLLDDVRELITGKSVISKNNVFEWSVAAGDLAVFEISER